MPIYKYTDPGGRTVYSDRPPSSAEVMQTSARERGPRTAEEQQQDHQTARKLAGEAQKRILKAQDYLDYLFYLRNHRSRDYNALLQELRRTDAQAYAKLMKYPRFRPRGEAALGGKAAEKSMTAVVGLMSGNYRGTLEKWLETSVKESMDRNGWAPKALGSRSSTLPAAAAPSYSNSRLGQYLKVEDARAAKASSRAWSFLKSSTASLRAAAGTATTRLLGPFLDAGWMALQPETAKGVSGFWGHVQARELFAQGVLSLDQWETAERLNSQGKLAELDRFLRKAKADYVRTGVAQ